MNPEITVTLNEDQARMLFEIWGKSKRVLSPEDILQIVISMGLEKMLAASEETL